MEIKIYHALLYCLEIIFRQWFVYLQTWNTFLSKPVVVSTTLGNPEYCQGIVSNRKKTHECQKTVKKYTFLFIANLSLFALALSRTSQFALSSSCLQDPGSKIQSRSLLTQLHTCIPRPSWQYYTKFGFFAAFNITRKILKRFTIEYLQIIALIQKQWSILHTLQKFQ